MLDNVITITLSGVDARAFPPLHESGHETSRNPNRFGQTDVDGVNNPGNPVSYLPNYSNNAK